MTIQQGHLQLDQREKRHGTRPTVDYLFPQQPITMVRN